jgi:hypothetical protein
LVRKRLDFYNRFEQTLDEIHAEFVQKYYPLDDPVLLLKQTVETKIFDKLKKIAFEVNDEILYFEDKYVKLYSKQVRKTETLVFDLCVMLTSTYQFTDIYSKTSPESVSWYYRHGHCLIALSIHHFIPST